MQPFKSPHIQSVPPTQPATPASGLVSSFRTVAFALLVDRALSA